MNYMDWRRAVAIGLAKGWLRFPWNQVDFATALAQEFKSTTGPAVFFSVPIVETLAPILVLYPEPPTHVTPA